MGATSRVAASTAVLMMLAGCSSYPPLGVVVPASGRGPFDVDPAIGAARELQGEYKVAYEKVTDKAWIGQVPVLVAAGVAAGLLVANPANVANLVAYTGIAAGTWQLGRNAIAPSGAPLLYAQGFAALQCIVSEGQVFVPNASGGPNTPLGLLTDSATRLVSQIEASQSQVIRTLPAGGTEEKRKEALNEQQRLATLLVSARTLLDTARTEVAAGNQAGPVVGSAVSAVALRVATKGMEGRTISYQEALDQLKPPPAAKPQGTADADLQGFIDDIGASTTALQDSMNAVQAALAQTPYKATLDRVRACPDGVGA